MKISSFKIRSRIYRSLSGLLIFIFSTSLSYGVTAEEAYQTGLGLYKEGQWEQSIDQFREAVRQNPYHWQAYQSMGYAFVQDGDPRAALDACRISLQINPNNPALKAYVDTRLTTLIENAPPDLKPPDSPASPISTPPPAPAKARNSFYLQLGIASLVAPDNFLFGYSSGVQFEVGYGFGISPSFSILVDTQYCSFPMIPSYYPGIYGPGNQTAYVTGGGIQIISFLGNAKFNFVASNNPVVFYGIAGLGPEVFLEDAKYSTSVSATAPAYSEVDLALRLAIGIDIKLSPGLALAIENNSIETFVSQTLSNTGTFSRDNFSIGLKMDN